VGTVRGGDALANPDDHVSEHFTRGELSCPCCQVMGVKPEMIQFLERVRDACGFPLPIVSAYRCPQRNREIGATQTHATGLAVDPGGIRGAQAAILARYAFFHGVRGVGIGSDGSVRHLDIVPDDTVAADGTVIHRPRLWTYGRGL
jgi:uncharacterized protein YcbK (DUF882 family)